MAAEVAIAPASAPAPAPASAPAPAPEPALAPALAPAPATLVGTDSEADPEHTLVVLERRHPHERFGLSVEMDTRGVAYVSGVAPSSVAAAAVEDGQLRLGDRVIDINGRALQPKLDIPQQLHALTAQALRLSLTVGPPPAYEVTLELPKPTFGLGVGFDENGHARVDEIIPGTPAAAAMQAGQIWLGARLVSINDQLLYPGVDLASLIPPTATELRLQTVGTPPEHLQHSDASEFAPIWRFDEDGSDRAGAAGAAAAAAAGVAAVAEADEGAPPPSSGRAHKPPTADVAVQSPAPPWQPGDTTIPMRGQTRQLAFKAAEERFPKPTTSAVSYFSSGRKLTRDEMMKRLAAINPQASAALAAGELAQADALFVESARLYLAALGPGHPFTLDAMANAASLKVDRGDAEGALPFLEDVLHARRDAHGSKDKRTLEAMHMLGEALLQTTPPRTREAIKVFREETVVCVEVCSARRHHPPPRGLSTPSLGTHSCPADAEALSPSFHSSLAKSTRARRAPFPTSSKWSAGSRPSTAPARWRAHLRAPHWHEAVGQTTPPWARRRAPSSCPPDTSRASCRWCSGPMG